MHLFEEVQQNEVCELMKSFEGWNHFNRLCDHDLILFNDVRNAHDTLDNKDNMTAQFYRKEVF